MGAVFSEKILEVIFVGALANASGQSLLVLSYSNRMKVCFHV